MIGRLSIVCALAALGSVVPFSGANAATLPFGAVQLASRPAALHDDGSVDVVMWVRCKPGINAFELDTNVNQPRFGAFGQDVKVEANVVPCDGTRHRQVISIAPFQGEFRPGVASLAVFVGLYDGATDTDSDATDQVNVRLVRR